MPRIHANLAGQECHDRNGEQEEEEEELLSPSPACNPCLDFLRSFPCRGHKCRGGGGGGAPDYKPLLPGRRCSSSNAEIWLVREIGRLKRALKRAVGRLRCRGGKNGAARRGRPVYNYAPDDYALNFESERREEPFLPAAAPIVQAMI